MKCWVYGFQSNSYVLSVWVCTCSWVMKCLFVACAAIPWWTRSRSNAYNYIIYISESVFVKEKNLEEWDKAVQSFSDGSLKCDAPTKVWVSILSFDNLFPATAFYCLIEEAFSLSLLSDSCCTYEKTCFPVWICLALLVCLKIPILHTHGAYAPEYYEECRIGVCMIFLAKFSGSYILTN